MKLNWFKRKGIIYFPASITGWLIGAIAIIMAIYSFIDIDKHSHSVSDTMINFIFTLLIIALCYTIIAYFTEKKPVMNINEE